VPPDAAATRDKLLDAATRAFAEHGVLNASLLDITRQAGQRNRGALHYHFGSRMGVVCAVLERHVDFLAEREGELLAKALAAPDEGLRPVVEAVVRPSAELAESGWRGACFLRIVAELVEEDQSTLGEVREMIDRTGGQPVYDELERRMPPMPEELGWERRALFTSFFLRAVADRARVANGKRRRRPQLPQEPFIRNLVAMVAAALSAPVR